MKILLSAILALSFMTATSEAAGPMPDDHLRICVSDAACDAAVEEFKANFTRAHQRDYTAQRNVAFCLSNGCDGSVTINKTLSCAWRIVVLASGSPEVDGGDTMSHRVTCAELDKVSTATARRQAGVIFKSVYGEALPAAFR